MHEQQQKIEDREYLRVPLRSAQVKLERSVRQYVETCPFTFSFLFNFAAIITYPEPNLDTEKIERLLPVHIINICG
ncbi:hypothetical protein VSA01S_29840 [Vibrio sagamiensis NBRC 104589]|uniref:Uncharacterized protein n=1 Tax=Vibrio sagamiensis NBRC 104589 TaxID=1219064 RepID=A0A511QK81_9VIBR|nr:hypothetical protein VSA01S_29840 [Vibrio sagamiensis NBRC 104589]